MDQKTLALKLYVDDVYFAYYDGIRQSHRTNEEAYNAVEARCEEIYGVRVYDNYDTFRVALHRYKSIEKKEKGGKDISLLSAAGYWTRYQEIKTCGVKNVDAYMMLEGEVYKMYGVNVYNNLEAFMKAQNRWVKSRINSSLLKIIE
jgi:hypothetical protein